MHSHAGAWERVCIYCSNCSGFLLLVGIILINKLCVKGDVYEMESGALRVVKQMHSNARWVYPWFFKAENGVAQAWFEIW